MSAFAHKQTWAGFISYIQLLEETVFKVWEPMHQKKYMKKNVFGDKNCWSYCSILKQERMIQKLAQSHPVNY